MKQGPMDRRTFVKLTGLGLTAVAAVVENDRPLFLMGDFNCKPGSAPYNIFEGDKNSNTPSLMHDTIENGTDIDWILYKGDVKVLRYEEVDYNVDGVYPSDHNPIYVEFLILEK